MIAMATPIVKTSERSSEGRIFASRFTKRQVRYRGGYEVLSTSGNCWQNVTTSQHISGTCKMGSALDPLAVVDQYCRVYGLEGLRVADASVMPDVIRANTNATTIMIAERVADFMRYKA
jgi:choline dehydrogenase-like flavoprotein